MKIDAKELIERFYNEVAKDKYPKYDKKQIITACYIPFRYLRKACGAGHMPTIRFKYLGEFEPNVFAIVKFLEKSERKEFIRKFSQLWIRMMRINCQHVLDRMICELEESFLNEKELLTKSIDETEFKRLLKIYTKHGIQTEDYIEEDDSIPTGEL